MPPEIFESTHKVRPYECDFYGHVNNAIYLNYLEFARMETLEQKQLSLPDLKTMGFMILIRQIDIRYKSPALAGDQIAIRTRLKEYRQASGTFFQEIVRVADQRLLIEADVTWVVVNLAGRPLPIPDPIRRAFGLPLRHQPARGDGGDER